MGYLAFFVSSAMCPDASNPVMVPAVKRLAKHSIKVILFQVDITHKDRIQFHPAGAPVPLSGEIFELDQGNTVQKHTSHSKDFLGGAKTICLGNADRKPNQAKYEIHHHQPDRELEYHRIKPRGKIIYQNGENEESFGNSPDESPPFHIL